MTTVDRLDGIERAVPGWTPAVVAEQGTEGYVGKHRRPGGRSLALFHLFYSPRHRRD